MSQGASKKEIGRVFNRFDLDGNGKLSMPEFLAVMLTAGKQRKAAEAEFALYDLNGDGYISQDEFARVAVKLARRRCMRRRMLAETVGAGIVAWFGCVATVARPAIGNIACSTMMGASVAVAIYATRKFSGAHLNPAFTAASVASGSFRLRDAPAYMLAQLAGAMAASAAHAGLMLSTALRSVPATHLRTHLGIEVGVSFSLFLLIFLVGDEVRRGRLSTNLEPMAMAGVVSSVVLSAETAHLHVCLNPAVGLGGMLVSALSGVPSPFAGVGVSFCGPFIGALLAIPTFHKLEQMRDALFKEESEARRRRLFTLRRRIAVH